MGLKITVTPSLKAEPDVAPVTAVIYDDNVIEIPDFDYETELAAVELGFAPSAELKLYEFYIREGLPGLIACHPRTIDAAFKAQGYAAFAPDFEAADFVDMIETNLAFLSTPNTGPQIALYQQFVDFTEADAEFVTQAEYGATLAAALETAVRLDETYAVSVIASNLKLAMNDRENDMVFEQECEIDVDSFAPVAVVATCVNTIDIFGVTVGLWRDGLELAILNPITFDTHLTDLCELHDDYCLPEGIEALLDAFELEIPYVPEPQLLEVPESDPTGVYGVDYSFPGNYPHKVVPYGTRAEAAAAYELSQAVIDFHRSRGWRPDMASADAWTFQLVVLDPGGSGEWLEADWDWDLG